jgi:hypothetical protein
MLHTQTIEPAALELLKSLQSKDYLKGFNLVEGTALALYMGHRTSIDIETLLHIPPLSFSLYILQLI